jgi:surface antigen
VILGGLLGAGVGEYLNQRDRRYMADTTYDALENARTGQARAWSNPDTGHSGAITPVETYATAEGRNCREFRQTVKIDGREESAYGTACRQPDGSWHIVQ